MAVRPYNPSVRVGNWSEDIQLEEDTLKNFLYKRERGELLIQKTYNLFSTMLKKVELSVTQDFAVHFGDQVMLQCAGDKDRTQYFINQIPRNDCVVALNVSDPNVLFQVQITGKASVTGSQTIEPNQRTVFSIESVGGGQLGAKLRYGQPFYLRTVGEHSGNLYLFSDKLSFKTENKSRHQELLLVPEPSFLTQWMCLYRNPLLRLEYEHEPVMANDELIIVHCKTNQALAVEGKYLSRTPFGREYELAVWTYLNSHKAEEPQNHWMIVMSVPGSTVRPVPDQGKLHETVS